MKEYNVVVELDGEERLSVDVFARSPEDAIELAEEKVALEYRDCGSIEGFDAEEI